MPLPRSELMELYRLHLQQSDMPTDFGTLLQLRCAPPTSWQWNNWLAGRWFGLIHRMLTQQAQTALARIEHPCLTRACHCSHSKQGAAGPGL